MDVRRPAPMSRGMTSRGKQTAALVGILFAFALPKKTPCLSPRTSCELVEAEGTTCTPTDLEPFGVFALEWLIGDDLGVQYRRWLDCP